MASDSLGCSTPSNSCDIISISKVRVVIKVRPFLPDEIAAKNGEPISCVSRVDKYGKDVTVHLKDQETSRNESYQLDDYFGQDENNVIQIFKKEVNPLIAGIFHGYNATVFAYGATGSGKTYTMQGTKDNPGQMPLAMSKILAMCNETKSVVEISYYEVYLDRCYDLLELKAKEISIWDDKDGQIHLRGLSKVPVKNMSEFYEIFSRGVERRKTAHTSLNNVSSRSHAVLVVIVSTPCSDESGGFMSGKLNLIDLAGNEDIRRTCNEGIRLQESGKINQSLFALSNVIYALNRNLSRVPYRESKLTRILQDSLGGTSHSLMIACLNPGEYHESIHTISLAARSRHITNYICSSVKKATPKGSVDMEAKLRAWLESKGKTKNVQRMEAFGSPFLVKTPSSKQRACRSSSTKTNKKTANPKERIISSSFRHLLHDEAPQPFDSTFGEARENQDVEEGPNEVTDKTLLDSKAEFPEGIFRTNKSILASNHSKLSSPASKSKHEQQDSRKALSPISVSVNNKSEESVFSSAITLFSEKLEPKTPKTPFSLSYVNEPDTTLCTPLEKFGAMSLNLKICFEQEYIDLLNSASREELLELKGIGVKMAEYIVELRERSPLKSLKDLEKIGLSLKQIHNLFSKGAREIFARTTVCSES